MITNDWNEPLEHHSRATSYRHYKNVLIRWNHHYRIVQPLFVVLFIIFLNYMTRHHKQQCNRKITDLALCFIVHTTLTIAISGFSSILFKTIEMPIHYMNCTSRTNSTSRQYEKFSWCEHLNMFFFPISNWVISKN